MVSFSNSAADYSCKLARLSQKTENRARYSFTDQAMSCNLRKKQVVHLLGLVQAESGGVHGAEVVALKTRAVQHDRDHLSLHFLWIGDFYLIQPYPFRDSMRQDWIVLAFSPSSKQDSQFAMNLFGSDIPSQTSLDHAIAEKIGTVMNSLASIQHSERNGCCLRMNNF
jgi:hypothetical protein